MKIIKVNNKAVDITTIELDGIESFDCPDFCDAYVDSAKFKNGTELTNEECESLTMDYPDLINTLANGQFWIP
jgi:hypothetical protein